MAKKISAAAVGAAVSLVFIILSRFVPTMKLTFVVLASVGTIIPMSRGYVRESALSAIVVIIVGAIVAQTAVIPYVLVGSFYTVLTILCYQKKVRQYFLIPAKILYATLVFYVVYSLVGLFVVDLDKIIFLQNLSSVELFFVLDAVFVVAFFVFDFIELRLYEAIRRRLASF